MAKVWPGSAAPLALLRLDRPHHCIGFPSRKPDSGEPLDRDGAVTVRPVRGALRSASQRNSHRPRRPFHHFAVARKESRGLQACQHAGIRPAPKTASDGNALHKVLAVACVDASVLPEQSCRPCASGLSGSAQTRTRAAARSANPTRSTITPPPKAPRIAPFDLLVEQHPAQTRQLCQPFLWPRPQATASTSMVMHLRADGWAGSRCRQALFSILITDTRGRRNQGCDINGPPAPTTGPDFKTAIPDQADFT